MTALITPEDIAAHFTQPDGSYRFARWGRPLAPIVFGVEEETLPIVKGAIEAVAALAGQEVVETDPELGANLMVFFFRDWQELTGVPNLDRLLPGLGPLVDRLDAAEATQYRAFRFDEAGAIRACFVFIRMAGDMLDLPAETLALGQAVQAILLWSEGAFASRSPLGRLENGNVILRPEIAMLIRAGYDPVLPAVAEDATHALRLFARVEASR
ncbi:hypothetical protein EDD52_12020 [Primorskyibacter sedentarius]|uniref:Uncharacterized protein n=1 Tax=Primorskyibacter sedentarius TaxID=745311 RepID=A0A4R3J1J4_9RHOB|nr:hypothetical protein [Primorskyibacter sedentarius]TCS59649.1 hypothetical protein EDD52_12020 [Primorskyibacter sedentarius]